MTLRLAILTLFACMIAACGQPDKDREDDYADTNPLLWEVARADGTTAGWLIGTIHALPSDAAWRTPATDRVIDTADMLAVEVANVADGRAMSNAFLPLAMSTGQPPLTERVSPPQRDRLARLVGKTHYRIADFDRIESWGAALILAQAVDTGADSENGIDRALIDHFSGRKVVELEGATNQFRAFDGLSEKAQRAMLASIIEDAQAGPDKLGEPMRLYLAGDVEGLEKLSYEGMLADPEIRTALLTRRNADWAGKIDRLLGGEQRPLIAVGAAHMVGEDGLVALLRAKGYRVTRLDADGAL